MEPLSPNFVIIYNIFILSHARLCFARLCYARLGCFWDHYFCWSGWGWVLENWRTVNWVERCDQWFSCSMAMSRPVFGWAALRAARALFASSSAEYVSLLQVCGLVGLVLFPCQCPEGPRVAVALLVICLPFVGLVSWLACCPGRVQVVVSCFFLGFLWCPM